MIDMQLADKCIGCGISFEFWVSGKIYDHVSKCPKITRVSGMTTKKYEPPRSGPRKKFDGNENQ